MLPTPKTAKQVERDKEYAEAKVRFAKKQIDDGMTRTWPSRGLKPWSRTLVKRRLPWRLARYSRRSASKALPLTRRSSRRRTATRPLASRSLCCRLQVIKGKRFASRRGIGMAAADVFLTGTPRSALPYASGQGIRNAIEDCPVARCPRLG